MTQSEIELRIKALEQQVAALLPGSVAKKTVNGREYFYHRWTENKKKRKIYPHEVCYWMKHLENYPCQSEWLSRSGF